MEAKQTLFSDAYVPCSAEEPGRGCIGTLGTLWRAFLYGPLFRTVTGKHVHHQILLDYCSTYDF
jgi:hypothetical protein